MPKELFLFRYRDSLTGKWLRARYLAERHEIAERYKEWEIVGPPEIRGNGVYSNGIPATPQGERASTARTTSPDHGCSVRGANSQSTRAEPEPPGME